MRFLFSIILLYATTMLVGCGAHVYHVVEPNETLYSIGWLYGYDYREVAKWNDISSPYSVKVGQRLRVAPYPGGEKVVVARKEEKTRGAVPQVSRKVAAVDKAVVWQWPAKGSVVNRFSTSKLNKGIDISGSLGQSVHSAAAGKVVYAGSGLVGYGNLVILNHSPAYLSAYAHNSEILVKEGQQVKTGEVIARMGSTGADQVMLHFEIRREGQPVDPLQFLPGAK